RLADIEHVAPHIDHAIDAGPGGQGLHQLADDFQPMAEAAAKAAGRHLHRLGLIVDRFDRVWLVGFRTHGRRLRRAGSAVKSSEQKRRAPMNVSLRDKFARGEPHDSAIRFTNQSRRLTNQSRYPRILWISLSKKPLQKCVSL